MVLTRWQSWSAITAFAGTDPQIAVVDSQAQTMLVRHDRVVQHFEPVHESGG